MRTPSLINVGNEVKGTLETPRKKSPKVCNHQVKNFLSLQFFFFPLSLICLRLRRDALYKKGACAMRGTRWMVLTNRRVSTLMGY